MSIATFSGRLTQAATVREGELSRLSRLVQVVHEGGGRTVELIGDPGTGKTWLLSGLVGQAERNGVTVLRSQCSEAGAAVPFQPFIHAFTNWRDGGKIMSEVAALISMLTARPAA